jgi:hypothetical protein
MSSAPAYSAPPRRAAAVSAAPPTSFSSFGREAPREAPREDFGGGSGRNGFDEAAAAAFGKKPARTFDAPPQDSAPKVVVKPARNTLASMLDDLLPPEPESKQREWSTSALQKQRKAAVEAEKSKPKPQKSYEEEFPTLGGARGGAGTVRVPKPVFATETSAYSTTAGSFASLAANWAKSEEERKAAEAAVARARLEQQRRDELERAERVHFRTNLNTRNHYYGDDGYGDNGYGDDGYGGDGYEDEYVEGELDEYESYSKKDVRLEKRAAANHYSDEEEDEETADCNIGTGGGGGAW